jgi:hypothetical protein
MRKAAAPLAVIVGLAGLFWLVKFPADGEMGRIKSRLTELTDLISEPHPSQGTGMLVVLAKLQTFFTEDVTVKINDQIPQITGRDQLVAIAHRGLQHESGIEVRFEDMTVRFDQNESTASVSVTVVLTGGRSNEAQSIHAQALELDMLQVEGKWRIKTIRPLQVLRLE